MNKKLKILLVNPEVPNTFWSMKSALKFVSKKALLPPLGLLTVAAMLPEALRLPRPLPLVALKTGRAGPLLGHNPRGIQYLKLADGLLGSLNDIEILQG